MRIVALDAAALSLGLAPGLTLADARARVPELAAIDHDPLADRLWLERLADGCDRWTPMVALDPPDGVTLDITGCVESFTLHTRKSVRPEPVEGLSFSSSSDGEGRRTALRQAQGERCLGWGRWARLFRPRAYSAAINRSAAPRSTETRREMPCSAMVTPNRRCMRLIVTALWVTMR